MFHLRVADSTHATWVCNNSAIAAMETWVTVFYSFRVTMHVNDSLQWLYRLKDTHAHCFSWPHDSLLWVLIPYKSDTWDIRSRLWVLRNTVSKTNNMLLIRQSLLKIKLHTVFPRLIPLGYYYLHTYNPNVLYLNNATVRYYSRVRYYFYTYKQLYAISFLFFNNLASYCIQNDTIHCKW